MIKNFNYKGRFIISKTVLGFGFILEFKPPFACIEVNWILKIDLLYIRFWIESINKSR